MKNFHENFIQKFAIIITLLTYAFDICFLFVDFPEKNRDIINMIAGVLNTVCLVTIINFFFGSSKGSKDKQDLLNEVVVVPSAADALKSLREQARLANVSGYETMNEAELKSALGITA